MNAFRELDNAIRERHGDEWYNDVEWARIIDHSDISHPTYIELKKDHDDADIGRFLIDVDFYYHERYSEASIQTVSGIVVMKDGSKYSRPFYSKPAWIYIAKTE